jgi:hypothetical protein
MLSGLSAALTVLVGLLLARPLLSLWRRLKWFSVARFVDERNGKTPRVVSVVALREKGGILRVPERGYVR